MSGPLEVHDIIVRLMDGPTVLDVGCGWGRLGYLLRTNWFYSQDTKQLQDCLIGVDVFSPTLKRIKYHRIYDDVVLCDAEHLPFRDGAFQVVLASEIIEHIDKNRGLAFIKDLERTSNKTVIITTPHYPGRRGGILLPEGFNPYERHVASWSYSELRRLGYSVYGRGFALLGVGTIGTRSPEIGSRFPRLLVFVAQLLSSMTVLFPGFASFYVAKKHVKREAELSTKNVSVHAHKDYCKNLKNNGFTMPC